MKVILLVIGKKSANPYLLQVNAYLKLLNNYINCELQFISPASHYTSANQIKHTEYNSIQSYLKKKKYYRLVLLDEKGRQYTSIQFSKQLLQWKEASQDIILLLGGTYGFDEKIYHLTNTHISLTSYTLPHPLALLVLSEQLYRASTILLNTGYHH